MAPNYTIHGGDHRHLAWDNSTPPAMTVAPGDIVQFDDLDATSGQLSANSTVDDIRTLDFGLINPIAGPVYVDGAEPGDALKVTLLEFQPNDWAWTAIVPGFGLLADDFPEAALHIWSYDNTFDDPGMYGDDAWVPMKPFCGTIGVAPGEAGAVSTVPPTYAGGNMDIRDLSAGAELYLPVSVPGALFSIGDSHCAQGDGEVCGTAIESPLGAVVKFELSKGENLKFPRFVTPGPVTRHLDGKGYEVTTGIGPDLTEASKDAVRGMIDRLGASRGLSPERAYMLCSVCADMRISEIVDIPNWVLSCYLPRIVFE